MRDFEEIYCAALKRCGSETAIKKRLPQPKSKKQLIAATDAEYLSLMSRRIFRAGLKHSMVDAKWPAFEEVFHQFQIEAVSMMSDEMLEGLMNDKRIIRHWGKIKSVRANAQAIAELRQDYESVGQYLAEWPCKNIIDLWDDLKKQFTQLGGNSGPYFLRMAGKDTFLFSKDVIKALIKWTQLGQEPKRKQDRCFAQGCFNNWHNECKRPLSQISMILALSVD